MEKELVYWTNANRSFLGVSVIDENMDFKDIQAQLDADCEKYWNSDNPCKLARNLNSGLLNKDASKYTDYSQLAQDFFETLINAGIRCRHVQAEVILNRLIRDANDIYSRPDFRKFENPEYKILTLNQALINTKAPTVSFSYQELKRQILGDALYTEKNGSSYLDPLYANKIKTDRLKAIAKKLREKRLNNHE